MICKFCLTEIDDDSVFCENCGNRVHEKGSNDETQLLPEVEVKKPVIPSRSAAFADKVANEEKAQKKDMRVNDISKLLAEIYDDEEAEEPVAPEKSVSEEKCAAQDEILLSPDIILPAEPKGVAPKFCMACGRKLPEGAAFCDICGTETGAVEPSEIKRRKQKGSIAVPILKEYFKKPAEMIEKATDAEAFPLGVGVLLTKNLLTAIAAALCMGKFSEVLTNSWLITGDAFGFAAKVFLIAVLADIILLGIVFGTGVLFKAGGTVKEITAVCGTGSLLPSAAWLIALVLTAFSPAAGMCFVLVSIVITAVYLGQAITAVSRINKNKSMYMVMLVMVIYIALIYGGLTWMIA